MTDVINNNETSFVATTDGDTVNLVSLLTGDAGNVVIADGSGDLGIDGMDNGTDSLNRDFIWSDVSQDAQHSYAEFTGNNVDDDSSSRDWTNGFLLNIEELSDTNHIEQN